MRVKVERMEMQGKVLRKGDVYWKGAKTVER